METLPGVVRIAIARFLTRYETIQWLLHAADTHNHDLVRLLLYRTGFPLASCRADLVHAAAASGCVRALALLLTKHPKSCHHCHGHDDTYTLWKHIASHWQRGFPESVLFDAIEKIHDDADAMTVVAWLHPRTRYDPVTAVRVATYRHRLVLAQWLATVSTAAATDTTTATSMTRRVEVVVPYEETVNVLHWLEHVRSGDGAIVTSAWFASAVHGVTVRVGRRFDDARVPLLPAIDFAAQVGDLLFLQTLHNDPRVAWPCTTRAMDVAAARGDMAMVQWLHQYRTEGCSSAAMDDAATNGHVEMVKWLYYVRQERGTPRAFHGAASNGHVPILRWQRTRFPHFQLSTSALETAARGGHVDVLRWVDETVSRVVISPAMMHNAINGGHLDTVRWLVEKARTQPPHDPRRFMQSHLLTDAAATTDPLELLQWLWSEFQIVSLDWLAVAVEHANTPVVEWLLDGSVLKPHEQRLRDGSLYTLATRGHWTVLEWLFVHHEDLCLGRTFLPPNVLRRSMNASHRGRDEHPWLPRYTRLVLRYAPSLCLLDTVLPTWAARHALDDILHELWTRTPAVLLSDPALLDVMIKSMVPSTAHGIVEAILTAHPEQINSRVVQWAATYAHVTLLDVLFVMSTPTKRRHWLRTAVCTACRHGHVAVLAWVVRKETSDGESRPVIDLWRGATLVAARHGHDRVVALLRNAGYQRETEEAIQAVAGRCHGSSCPHIADLHRPLHSPTSHIK